MCEGARHSSSLGRRPVRQHDRPAEGPSPGSAVSGLGADEIDQIVQGDDLEVVEEGMSALPVSSGSCRPSRIAGTMSAARGKAR
jgi:hypothetical protein